MVVKAAEGANLLFLTVLDLFFYHVFMSGQIEIKMNFFTVKFNTIYICQIANVGFMNNYCYDQICVTGLPMVRGKIHRIGVFLHLILHQ